MMIYLLYTILVIYGIALLVIGFIWFCYNTVTVYPHSKTSKWIRKHIITEKDLDPPSSKG